MNTTRIGLCLVVATATFGSAFGCAFPDATRVSEAPLGSARLALTDVPDDVSCIRVDAVGSETVSTLLDVTPGQPASITLEGQPVGVVAFSADAFPSTCAVVTSGTVPTWVSDTAYSTLTAGVPVDISLVLRPNGQTDVAVTFSSGATCHEADGPCLDDADCCSGVCFPNQVCAGVCSANGSACTSNAECCDGQCSGSTCCVPEGNACTTHSDCCSNNCDAGSCGPVVGSLCDNSGACGDQGTGCTACALAGNCQAANDACLNGQDCLDFLGCVGACSDQTCYDACVVANPVGAGLYDAILQCVYCQECPVDCVPANLGITCQ